MVSLNKIVEVLKKYGINIKKIAARMKKKKEDKKYLLSRKMGIVIDNKINLNPEIIEFFRNLGIVDTLDFYSQQIIKGEDSAKKSDFDYTLAAVNTVYQNKSIEKVYVKDIIGMLSHDKDQSLLKVISDIYFYESDMYYDKVSEEYIESLLKKDLGQMQRLDSPIKLINIGDKYYVDGNPRLFYLLLVYLIEKEKLKNNEDALKELDERLKIEVVVQKKSSYEIINFICYCLSKCGIQGMKMIFTDDKESIGVLTYNDQSYEIFSEEEFIEHFELYFTTLKDGSLEYKMISEQLIKNNYFTKIGEYEVNNLKIKSRKKVRTLL